MNSQTAILSIVSKTLGLKATESDIEWSEVEVSGGVALVPNKMVKGDVKFSWLQDRLLPLMNGGVVKIQNRYFQVGLPRKCDIDKIRDVLEPNLTFWVKSTNPRTCKIGPRKGKYVRLANPWDTGVGILPVLYEIKEVKQKVKSVLLGWKRALVAVVKKIVKKVGAFFSDVWAYCKGWKDTHARRGHWRKVGSGDDERFVWVKPCTVRGHFYGEAV